MSSSARRELPGWFYRVTALSLFPDAEIHPHYFDEDISDLSASESGDDVEEVDCDCDNEDQCDCYVDDETTHEFQDDASQKSYQGSDASWYYELKGLRENRKRELQSWAKERQQTRKYESCKEEEVRTAYKALDRVEKESEIPHMSSLANKSFRLYSTDYLDQFSPSYWEHLRSKYIEFYAPETSLELSDRQASGDEQTVEGHVYLNGNTWCPFLPFRSPTRPSRERRLLNSCQDPHGLTIQFISDKYIWLEIPRELVFDGHWEPAPASAPAVFEFGGILRDLDKEKEERLSLERRNRSPSCESWLDSRRLMW